MGIRTGEAEWQGSLSHGTGVMRLGSGAFEGRYSFGSRFGNEIRFGLQRARVTNPEELVAAAHAGCFSMALAHGLGRAGFAPKRIHTSAKAQVEPSGDGFKIIGIHLDAVAEVPRIDEAKFREYAETARRDCPVSRALAGTDITLTARLIAN